MKPKNLGTFGTGFSKSLTKVLPLLCVKPSTIAQTKKVWNKTYSIHQDPTRSYQLFRIVKPTFLPQGDGLQYAHTWIFTTKNTIVILRWETYVYFLRNVRVRSESSQIILHTINRVYACRIMTYGSEACQLSDEVMRALSGVHSQINTNTHGYIVTH